MVADGTLNGLKMFLGRHDKFANRLAMVTDAFGKGRSVPTELFEELEDLAQSARDELGTVRSLVNKAWAEEEQFTKGVEALKNELETCKSSFSDVNMRLTDTTERLASADYERNALIVEIEKHKGELSQQLTRDVAQTTDVRDNIVAMAVRYRQTAQNYVWIVVAILLALAAFLILARWFYLGDNAASTAQNGEDITGAISGSVLQVGAVVVAIYFSQMLVNFSRYHYRVADKLFCKSNALNLAIVNGDDLADLDKFAQTLSLDIDFGKMPATPTDKILDVVSKVKPPQGGGG